MLAPNGELWVYNLAFPGVLVDDPGFSLWHKESYLARFPSPRRHSQELEALLEELDLPLQLADDRWLTLEVAFTAHRLRNYLTTQSNVAEALRNGASLREIDVWLDADLGQFFPEPTERRFLYVCRSQVAAPA